MSDTDFFRYVREGVVNQFKTYGSLKNARSGVRHAVGLDQKYGDRWPDAYGIGRTYVIQQLVAVESKLVWQDVESRVS